MDEILIKGIIEYTKYNKINWVLYYDTSSKLVYKTIYFYTNNKYIDIRLYYDKKNKYSIDISLSIGPNRIREYKFISNNKYNNLLKHLLSMIKDK